MHLSALYKLSTVYSEYGATLEFSISCSLSAVGERATLLVCALKYSKWRGERFEMPRFNCGKSKCHRVCRVSEHCPFIVHCLHSHQLGMAHPSPSQRPPVPPALWRGASKAGGEMVSAEASSAYLLWLEKQEASRFQIGRTRLARSATSYCIGVLPRKVGQPCYPHPQGADTSLGRGVACWQGLALVSNCTINICH